MSYATAKAERVTEEQVRIWIWHCPDCNTRNTSRRHPAITDRIYGRCGTCHTSVRVSAPDPAPSTPSTVADAVHGGNKKAKGKR